MINIRRYEEKDYIVTSEILNQLLYPLVKSFLSIEEIKGPEYIRDFSIITKNENDGLYVITVDDKVSGIIKLATKEMKKEYKPDKSKLKKYKLRDRIKSIFIFSVLETKVKEEELYVDFIVVDENARGLGLGTKLLTFGLNQAKKLSKSCYFLHVLDSNPLGKKLYERFGFKQVKENKFPKYIAKRLGAKVDYRMEIDIKK